MAAKKENTMQGIIKYLIKFAFGFPGKGVEFVREI